MRKTFPRQGRGSRKAATRNELAAKEHTDRGGAKPQPNPYAEDHRTTRIDFRFGSAQPRRMKIMFVLVLTMAAGLVGPEIGAADWPNYRGPDHNGISTEAGWVAKWSNDGPKVLWKASLGLGYAPVSVAALMAAPTPAVEARTRSPLFTASPPPLGAISGSSPIRTSSIHLTTDRKAWAAPVGRRPSPGIACISLERVLKMEYSY